jgi:hypothetical protein
LVADVLGERQEDLALHRARPARTSSSESLCARRTGFPVLEDAISSFVCDVLERFPGGDHSTLTWLVRECGGTSGNDRSSTFRSSLGALRDANAELRETLGWVMPSLSGAVPARVTARL